MSHRLFSFAFTHLPHTYEERNEEEPTHFGIFHRSVQVRIGADE